MDTDRQAPPAAPVAAPPCTAAPRRGRPRSEAAEQAIFDAVERLMMDGTGLADLTIEGIAQAAGVGKATIYRRWPNKEALLVDAVVRLEDPEPVLSGRSAREDLIEVLEYMRRRGLAKRSHWVLMLVFNQLNSLPELKKVYYERVIRRRRQAIRAVTRRGVESGEFRADLDLDLLAELLVGGMLTRTVLWEDSPLDDPGLSATMVDALLAGLAGPAHVPAPAAAGEAVTGSAQSRRNPV
ncbi:AcrR family transcriptional regulator [Kitasatospora sp. MAP12-15]|uniref:TetR/AcrR family transcriptional regulator n=1 Tax=unclassified Kitasatospora TaxID=2633591 RepID=UPI0024771E42|nr:helix-turn-helix domain-containing protein [Kitasatospora sp. MAP12-44]MDH6110152.1 AcrR family transcriptional regulator [Kitasatospora sp. MAP12-44]